MTRHARCHLMLHSTDVVCTSHHESRPKRVSHRRDSIISCFFLIFSMFFFLGEGGEGVGSVMPAFLSVGRSRHQSCRICKVILATLKVAKKKRKAKKQKKTKKLRREFCKAYFLNFMWCVGAWVCGRVGVFFCSNFEF